MINSRELSLGGRRREKLQDRKIHCYHDHDNNEFSVVNLKSLCDKDLFGEFKGKLQ